MLSECVLILAATSLLRDRMTASQSALGVGRVMCLRLGEKRVCVSAVCCISSNDTQVNGSHECIHGVLESEFMMGHGRVIIMISLLDHILESDKEM